MSKIENNPHLKQKEIADQDYEDQLDGEDYDFDMEGELDFDSEMGLEGDVNVEGELDLQELPQAGAKAQLNAKTLAYKNLTGQAAQQGNNPNIKNMGGVAQGGEMGQILQDPQAQQFILNLKNQGLSNDQIKTMFQSQFGQTLSDESITYLTEGTQAFDSGATLTKYAGTYGPLTKQIGIQNSPFVADFMTKMMDQQMTADAKQNVREAKQKANTDQAKFKAILALVMLGNVEDAMKAYARMMEKDSRKMSLMIVDKLNRISKVRQSLLQGMAQARPPRPYTGENPQIAARVSMATQKFQSFMQVQGQNLSTVGDAQRDLLDELKSTRSRVDTVYEAAASAAEAHARSVSKTVG